jgi:hypothetical protein
MPHRGSIPSLLLALSSRALPPTEVGSRIEIDGLAEGSRIVLLPAGRKAITFEADPAEPGKVRNPRSS